MYQRNPLLKNGGLWYPDRHWINVFPGNATFTSETFDYVNARTSFFTYAYSASPGMAASMDNVGAKYPGAMFDADGDHLQGGKNYKLHVPQMWPPPTSYVELLAAIPTDRFIISEATKGTYDDARYKRALEDSRRQIAEAEQRQREFEEAKGRRDRGREGA